MKQNKSTIHLTKELVEAMGAVPHTDEYVGHCFELVLSSRVALLLEPQNIGGWVVWRGQYCINTSVKTMADLAKCLFEIGVADGVRSVREKVLELKELLVI